ncbi:MAG: hypothetical protein HJJLKODD_02532 [Phycisphaerae bacterium]|nr:hypothetical protein [Phycisphaerae bacterium]
MTESSETVGMVDVTTEVVNQEPSVAARHFLRRYWGWILGVLLLFVGFMGIDRRFYEQISLHINTTDRTTSTRSPYSHPDFYQRTRLFWEICRYWAKWFGGLLAYFLVLMIHPRGFRLANAGLLVVVCAAATASIAQNGFSRMRPNQADSHLAFDTPFARWVNGVTDSGYGFPSNEVATAFALSMALARIFPRWSTLCYVPAILVFIARVLPGMHYISDAAAGGLLGSLICRLLFDRLDRWQQRLLPSPNPPG